MGMEETQIYHIFSNCSPGVCSKNVVADTAFIRDRRLLEIDHYWKTSCSIILVFFCAMQRLVLWYSRLGGGSNSSIVSSGANQLRLLIVLVDPVPPLSRSVAVLLSQLALSLHLLLSQLGIVAAGGQASTINTCDGLQIMDQMSRQGVRVKTCCRRGVLLLNQTRFQLPPYSSQSGLQRRSCLAAHLFFFLLRAAGSSSSL